MYYVTSACIFIVVHAKSLQSCPIHCDSMYCSPPGSSVHGILQQEYWSGLPCPPPGDLPDPGIKPMSLMSPALAGGKMNIFTRKIDSEAEAPILWPP